MRGGCGFGVESSFHSSFGAQIETISDPGRSTIHVYCPNVLYGVLFWLDPMQVRYRILCIARSTRLHKSAM